MGRDDAALHNVSGERDDDGRGAKVTLVRLTTLAAAALEASIAVKSFADRYRFRLLVAAAVAASSLVTSSSDECNACRLMIRLFSLKGGGAKAGGKGKIVVLGETFLPLAPRDRAALGFLLSLAMFKDEILLIQFPNLHCVMAAHYHITLDPTLFVLFLHSHC